MAPEDRANRSRSLCRVLLLLADRVASAANAPSRLTCTRKRQRDPFLSVPTADHPSFSLESLENQRDCEKRRVNSLSPNGETLVHYRDRKSQRRVAPLTPDVRFIDRARLRDNPRRLNRCIADRSARLLSLYHGRAFTSSSSLSSETGDDFGW